MLLVWVLVSAQYVFAEPPTPDPAAVQLVSFKRKTLGPIGILTTTAGEPVEYRDAFDTINNNLLINRHFMNEMTHLVRERIPERVVHAKGTGAFGYFEVTHDITNICSADFLSEVGKKTPVAVRFSPAISGKGGSDGRRELRGFATKFYTEQGNLDLLGLSTEMFSIKDPVLFSPFVHADLRNPATNMFDQNSINDFRTLRPESLFMSLVLLSDHGIPDGYRHMPGFPVHTFQVVNKKSEIHFIRWHFIPDAGTKFLTTEEATRKIVQDPDFAVRDLYNAIANGTFPTWTVSLQILSFEDVKKAKLNVFDTTKILPHDTYPLQKVGRLVLNKNPVNHFAEIEQLAYDPDNLVPGIVGAPDKLFEGRRLAYRDAQLHRLGVNFNKITVNSPLQVKVSNYVRDGKAPVRDNGKDSPNYYPNSFHGPVPYLDKRRTELVHILDDDTPDNFDQIREFYKNELCEAERVRMASNIVTMLRSVASFIQERLIKMIKIIVPELGNRIILGLHANNTIIMNNHGNDYFYSQIKPNFNMKV